jgi:hypothetical protein
VVGSPWVSLLFVQLVLVAPLVEEVGKAAGAAVFRPKDRRHAFMAGVAAGAGFAIAENLLYASGGLFLGASWETVVLGRMLGAAVHPLASGLVVLGWWEWRQTRDLGQLARMFLAGALVHAVWNGTIVLLWVVGAAYPTSVFGAYGMASLGYAAALGAVAAAVLWKRSGSVADDQPFILVDSGDVRTVAAWTVLAATFIVPVALLVLAFPRLPGG